MTFDAGLSALAAGLVDLHRERGSLINGVAPMIGLGLGGLGSSLLVQFAPAPTRLVFYLLLLICVLLLVAAYFALMNVSYALVMDGIRPIRVGDKLKSPDATQ